jgi:allophanate hydrolase
MNLLDYAATAVPAGFQSNGLPFGVTLFAPGHRMAPCCGWPASCSGRRRTPPAAAPAGGLDAASGCPAAGAGGRGGRPPLGPAPQRPAPGGAPVCCRARTAPKYRFYALPDGKRPGLIRVKEGGAAIEMEVWELPPAQFGSFVAGIPAPLGIGKLELEDGAVVNGFICEGLAVADSMDITGFGGWRAWLAARAA